MSNTIVVSGYAKLPEGTAARHLYEVLTLVCKVDRDTHEVLEAESTLVTSVGRNWVKSRLEGLNLLEDPNPFVEYVHQEYWGNSQAALVQCFRDLVRRYLAQVSYQQG